jgi:hypothetical protein
MKMPNLKKLILYTATALSLTACNNKPEANSAANENKDRPIGPGKVVNQVEFSCDTVALTTAGNSISNIDFISGKEHRTYKNDPSGDLIVFLPSYAEFYNGEIAPDRMFSLITEGEKIDSKNQYGTFFNMNANEFFQFQNYKGRSGNGNLYRGENASEYHPSAGAVYLFKDQNITAKDAVAYIVDMYSSRYKSGLTYNK